ncbi:hypothetical protein [Bdellovibrio sp. HCB337]|uniref:hypothetical protein n=1 Tax=Bdellovibrio sp. HCB337 TaxID=3394358 RepID=UPI0039A78665
MNVLSLANAFNPGSDLWIVPDLQSCRWTQKLDWYLNFQIIKNQRHLSPDTRNFTKLIQRETGLETYELSVPKEAPLMITSEAFFPNKWVVVVPTSPNFGLWVREASAIWENLKHPSLRIFLPTGQNAGSFQKEWQKHHSFEDFTLVLD